MNSPRFWRRADGGHGVKTAVGEAPVSPISYRAVRDWGPFTEHGTAIGAIQAGTLLGPALGAPLVAWLISATSWQVSSMPPASLVWSGWWCGPR
jgi:MFS transporter, ACS family, D-galactonate transporter